MWTGHWLPILANYSQWLSGFAIFSGVGLLYRRHNCQRPWCWRMQWHPHPVDGHIVCKHHHPSDGS